MEVNANTINSNDSNIKQNPYQNPNDIGDANPNNYRTIREDEEDLTL